LRGNRTSPLLLTNAQARAHLIAAARAAIPEINGLQTKAISLPQKLAAANLPKPPKR